MPDHVSYPYALAFVHYTRGMELAAVAETLGIPINTLESRAKEERWLKLREEAMGVMLATVGEAPQEVELKAKLELMKRNRKTNFDLACKLRDEAAAVITDLLAGKKLKRYWHNKGSVVEHDVEWTMSDRVALANYLQMVANIGYQALGDAAGATAEKGLPSAQAAPSITVILPGLVAQPREKRVGESRVIDLRGAAAVVPESCRADGSAVVDV